MKKIVIILTLLVLILLGKIAYDARQAPPKAWIPVLEGTNFEYLDEALDEALNKLEAANISLAGRNTAKAIEELQQTRQSLLALKSYYVPMTEIRQLIYDADRFYDLGQTKKARANLQTARKLLMQIAGAGSTEIDKPVDEVLEMIDELMVAMDHRSAEVSDKFEALGHRVNLMLLKGALILDEVEFSGAS